MVKGTEEERKIMKKEGNLLLWILLIFIPPIGIAYMWIKKKNIETKKKTIYTIISLLWFFFCLGYAGSENSTENPNDKRNEKQVSDASKNESNKNEDSGKKEEPKKPAEPVKEHFEIDLSAGNYIGGKDIPVGTYNIVAISGSGNVSSSNMYSGGLNEIMGVENDGYSQQNFNGLKMDKDVVLSVSSSVVIHLVSEDAQTQNMTARSTVDSTPIDLQAGNYTSGANFPAGTYTVVSTGSSGNVSSSNIYNGGLNEIMGTDGFGITQFNNVVLPAETTLTISGTSVQLIPVGE